LPIRSGQGATAVRIECPVGRGNHREYLNLLLIILLFPLAKKCSHGCP
jgi:hypothetical protein